MTVSIPVSEVRRTKTTAVAIVSDKSHKQHAFTLINIRTRAERFRTTIFVADQRCINATRRKPSSIFEDVARDE